MKPWKKAFTLIELLVVISIISLLISILLPTLSSARAAGRQVQCLSNIRQIGFGVNVYTDDHHEYFPPGIWAASYFTTYAELVSPYMGIGEGLSPQSTVSTTPNYQHGTWENALWYCPVKGRMNDWESDSSYSGHSRSYGAYGANSMLMPFWDTDHWYFASHGVKDFGRRTDQKNIPDPSKTIQNMDHYSMTLAPQARYWNDATTTFKFRHMGTVDTDQVAYTVPDTGNASTVFVDGHAELLSASDVPTTKANKNWILD